MKSAFARPASALAIAAMLTLVGCGRDSTGGGDTARPIGERRASGEITVWAMGSEGEKLSVLAQDFMKVNPDAKVTVTPIPWDGAHDKIATAIAG